MKSPTNSQLPTAGHGTHFLCIIKKILEKLFFPGYADHFVVKTLQGTGLRNAMKITNLSKRYPCRNLTGRQMQSERRFKGQKIWGYYQNKFLYRKLKIFLILLKFFLSFSEN